MRSLLIRILVLGHWAVFSCQPGLLSLSFVSDGGWEGSGQGRGEVYKEAENLVCLDFAIYKLRDVGQVDLSFPFCKVGGDAAALKSMLMRCISILTTDVGEQPGWWGVTILSCFLWVFRRVTHSKAHSESLTIQ